MHTPTQLLAFTSCSIFHYVAVFAYGGQFGNFIRFIVTAALSCISCERCLYRLFSYYIHVHYAIDMLVWSTATGQKSSTCWSLTLLRRKTGRKEGSKEQTKTDRQTDRQTGR